MAIAKPVRALAVVSLLLLCYLLFLVFRQDLVAKKTDDLEQPILDEPMYKGKLLCSLLFSHCSPSLETHEPPGPKHRADDYAADNPNAPRINATLLALVRNSELDDMITSMRDLERTWNRKFNYPWTFFNDIPFDEEFKRRTQLETKAKCHYGSTISHFLLPDRLQY